MGRSIGIYVKRLQLTWAFCKAMGGVLAEIVGNRILYCGIIGGWGYTKFLKHLGQLAMVLGNIKTIVLPNYLLFLRVRTAYTYGLLWPIR